jgi:hypothetical protein
MLILLGVIAYVSRGGQWNINVLRNTNNQSRSGPDKMRVILSITLEAEAIGQVRACSAAEMIKVINPHR